MRHSHCVRALAVGGWEAMPEITPNAVIGRALHLYRDQLWILLAAALLLFLVNLVVTLLIADPLVGLVSLVVTIFYQGMVVQLVRDLQDGRRDHGLVELFTSVGGVVLPLIAV